jgi:light-regulated signal transduction histidine kinase (bacteriophytochrome)
VKKPDGEEIWEFWTDRALYDENGRFVEYQSVGRDITERKKAEEEIWKLNQELELRVLNRTAQLETSNEELEAFSYSVSHDLRAPLRAIHGFSEILLEDFADTLDNEGKGYLDRILVNSRKMENLIDDLLALSLLGRRDLNPKTIDITALVKVVIGELSENVSNRKIDFIVAECPSIEADESLVEMMLTNLISNAIKFTRDRKKTIVEFGCLKDQKKSTYYLKDNGIGFNMANAKNLFTPFQRLHPDRNFEGTGIGLAIVQRIIQRHGGQVWAEAKVDKGATFFFTI